MTPDWLEILRYIGVALATHLLPKLLDYGKARLTADRHAQVQADSTALTREAALSERVTKLEGQVEGLNKQLLESERVRAEQRAQLTDVRGERDTWKAQFHDLAVSVQAEDEPTSARIWMRYQAEQIARSAPAPRKNVEEP